jgi:hypothetical protein
MTYELCSTLILQLIHRGALVRLTPIEQGKSKNSTRQSHCAYRDRLPSNRQAIGGRQNVLEERGHTKMNTLSPQCISSTAEVPAGARVPASEATSSHCKSRHRGAPRCLIYCRGCRRRHCPSARCRGAQPVAKVRRTARRPRGSSSYRRSRGPLRHRSPSRVELPP